MVTVLAVVLTVLACLEGHFAIRRWERDQRAEREPRVQEPTPEADALLEEFHALGLLLPEERKRVLPLRPPRPRPRLTARLDITEHGGPPTWLNLR